MWMSNARTGFVDDESFRSAKPSPANQQQSPDRATRSQEELFSRGTTQSTNAELS